MSTQPSFLRKALTSQWSFFWAGIAFGVAQVVYMIGLWIPNILKGKDTLHKPITVTTDLGKMFRGMEVFIYDLFALPDFELYGKAIDGQAASGGAFVPGIGWAILGMAIGGWLVGKLEHEHRTWVFYPRHVLFISFLGGILFSYGTRLAGGCTLNHLLGGIPLLNIHSIVTAVFMAIGGGIAFMVLSRFDMAPFFKHQETKDYVTAEGGGEARTWVEGYNPRRRPVFWISGAFAVVFFGVALYGGLANPESLQALKDGELIAFSKSVAAKGWPYVLLTLIAGIIGGFGMAKSGFGTECALVAAESAGPMKNDDSRFARMGVPKITRTLMRSYLPLIGIMASWVVMLGFIMITWVLFGTGPGFAGSIKYQLTIGNLIGGLFLGAGAVMLVGCEIRSYMRIGMGYLNTWVGFMGFAIGYLPFTLFYDGHKAFLSNTLLVEEEKVYGLFSDSETFHMIFLGLWWVVLFLGLVYFIRRGARFTGASTQSLMNKSTEDVQREIDAAGKSGGGVYGGVSVPQPVPMAPETRG
jgi:hypothetical protein